jgi:glycosyltransferase involved in cell wall biosynthesis
MIHNYIKKRLKSYFLSGLQHEIDVLKYELDMSKSSFDVGDGLLKKFRDDKKSDIYARAYEEEYPLVTVCIATYNRGDVLVERSLASVLQQEYDNLEIIVVGDCCTDNTGQLISNINDPRIRFVNLPERGQYPEESEWRWMVAGTAPTNKALELANGAFITHLDDDDEHPNDRIAKLVNFIQETRADLVWHPFRWEVEPGQWRLNKAEKFKLGQVTTSSIFYHNWFKNIPWSAESYKYREPGDWNRLRKIQYLGARLVRYPEPLLDHYKERNQIEK